ncbi:hypothetical protein NX059_007557 [Plenodomus lindquistii]|nr:hypothetical protein NX059_007557 [Plenodomus lindquistii]
MMMSSILHQILTQQPQLKNDVLPIDQLNREWTYDQLFASLQSALNSKVSKGVTCFIDAIDECDPAAWKKLAKDLRKIFDASALSVNSQRHKLIVSSRDYPDIYLTSNVLDLDVAAEMHEALHEYIRHAATELVRTRPTYKPLLSYIIEELESRANGMYLLIELCVDRLEDLSDSTPTGLKVALQEVPHDIAGMYDNVWNRIPEAECRRARNMFSWLSCAQRPLIAQELAVALAIDRVGPNKVISLDLLAVSMDLEGDIKRLLGPLIQFRPILGLSHQSIKDHFLSQDASPGTKEGDKLEPVEIHAQLALTCLRYLNSPSHRNRLRAKEEACVFLDYALEYAPTHMALGAAKEDVFANEIEEFYRQGIWITNWKHVIKPELEQANLSWMPLCTSVSSLACRLNLPALLGRSLAYDWPQEDRECAHERCIRRSCKWLYEVLISQNEECLMPIIQNIPTTVIAPMALQKIFDVANDPVPDIVLNWPKYIGSGDHRVGRNPGMEDRNINSHTQIVLNTNLDLTADQSEDCYDHIVAEFGYKFSKIQAIVHASFTKEDQKYSSSSEYRTMKSRVMRAYQAMKDGWDSHTPYFAKDPSQLTPIMRMALIVCIFLRSPRMFNLYERYGHTLTYMPTHDSEWETYEETPSKNNRKPISKNKRKLISKYSKHKFTTEETGSKDKTLPPSYNKVFADGSDSPKSGVSEWEMDEETPSELPGDDVEHIEGAASVSSDRDLTTGSESEQPMSVTLPFRERTFTSDNSELTFVRPSRDQVPKPLAYEYGTNHYVETLFSADSMAVLDMAKKGNHSGVMILVQEGAGVRARDSNNATVLHWAARSRNPQLVDFILGLDRGENINARDHKGETPLHYSCSTNSIWENQVYADGRPDHISRAAVVQSLLAAGAERNTRNNDGNTSLQSLARNYVADWSDLPANSDLRWRETDLESCLEALIEDANDLLRWDSQGTPLIHYAVYLWPRESIRYVIQCMEKSMIPISLVDRQGHTPLHYAILRPFGDSAAIINILSQAGVDFRVRDAHGMDAVATARKYKNLEALEQLIKLRESHAASHRQQFQDMIYTIWSKHQQGQLQRQYRGAQIYEKNGQGLQGAWDGLENHLISLGIPMIPQRTEDFFRYPSMAFCFRVRSATQAFFTQQKRVLYVERSAQDPENTSAMIADFEKAVAPIFHIFAEHQQYLDPFSSIRSIRIHRPLVFEEIHGHLQVQAAISLDLNALVRPPSMLPQARSSGTPQGNRTVDTMYESVLETRLEQLQVRVRADTEGFTKAATDVTRIAKRSDSPDSLYVSSRRSNPDIRNSAVMSLAIGVAIAIWVIWSCIAAWVSFFHPLYPLGAGVDWSNKLRDRTYNAACQQSYDWQCFQAHSVYVRSWTRDMWLSNRRREMPLPHSQS